jgi:outer membrane cobalamin receptor
MIHLLKKLATIWLLTAAVLGFSSIAIADDQLFELKLEDVLDMPVRVSSKGVKQSVRQAAGSITVLDAKYLEESGARDLKEVLELVPGFQMLTDGTGADLFAFRGGNSGGQILVRLDGQEMNEYAFNGVQLGNHFPLASIERVEIIRGPGSVLYGGEAEYAVIEITTKKPTTNEKGLAALNLGGTSEGWSRQGGTLWTSIGDENKYLTASVSGGDATRGSGDFQDFYGDSFRMRDIQQHQRLLNIGGKFHDFSFRYIGDRYSADNQDQFFQISDYPIEQKFDQDRAEVKYSTEIAERLTGTFQLNYGNDQPWTNGDAGKELELSDPYKFTAVAFNQRMDRRSATAELLYNADNVYSILAGARYYEDHGRGFRVDGTRTPNFDANDKAVYAEAIINSTLATATLGTRFEDNSNYGSAWVSRAALTRSESDWHTKLQLAQSFRPPGFQNTIAQFEPGDPDYKIEPEKTLVGEIEGGHAIGDKVYATVTLFEARTDDSITYFYDNEHGDSYHNAGEFSSRGVEGTAKYLFDKGSLALTYAYLQANELIPEYQIRTPAGDVIDDKRFVGLAPHMGTLSGTYQFSPKFRFSSALSYQSAKYANTSVNEDDIPVPERINPTWMWRAALLSKDVGMKNLDFQLGVNNILDDDIVYTRNSGKSYHAPMPALGREFFVNAIYRW